MVREVKVLQKMLGPKLLERQKTLRQMLRELMSPFLKSDWRISQ